MEFTALTDSDLKALDIGEFRLWFPLSPAGPTFYGLPLRKFPAIYEAERYFQGFYELLKPPVHSLAVPQLRPALQRAFGGKYVSLEPNKIFKVIL